MSAITISDDTCVSVQRQWDGWQRADVRVGDLEDIHWWQPPRAPRPLLHAYITPSKLGDSAWAGASGASAQERLLVCVLKSHTPPDTYSALARRSAGGPGGLLALAPDH